MLSLVATTSILTLRSHQFDEMFLSLAATDDWNYKQFNHFDIFYLSDFCHLFWLSKLNVVNYNYNINNESVLTQFKQMHCNSYPANFMLFS